MYGSNFITILFTTNAMQFECCGVETPGDWLTTPFYKDREALPPSCCSGSASNQTCEVGGTATHFTGCFAKVLGVALTHVDAFGGVGIVVGLVEVVVVVVALWLCCSVHMTRKEPVTKSGPELMKDHKPCKQRCIQCLSKVCPCVFAREPDVPGTI